MTSADPPRELLVALLDRAFDEVQIGLALLSLTAHVLRVNPAGAALLGRKPDELVGQELGGLVHPDDLREALGEVRRLEAAGSAGPIVVRLRCAGGHWRWIRAHATLLPATDPVGFVVFEDVTDELAVADALREAEARSARRYAQQLDVVAIGRLALSGVSPQAVAQRATEVVLERLGAHHVAVLTDDGHEAGLLQMAGAGSFAAMTGVYRRPRDEPWREVVRRGEALFVHDLLHGEVPLTDEERAAVVGAELRSVVLCPILPSKAAPGALVAASLDTALALSELRHQALHDALTGLANRSLVLEHLELSLQRAKRHGHDLALVMCDVDRFKTINDGYGHPAGDEVLRVVGRRIARHLRPGDLLGRFGGDELVVVLTELEDPEQAEAVARRLVDAVRAPIAVGDEVIRTSISVGVAAASGRDGCSSAELLRRADAALYEAKAAGRDRVVVAD